MNSSSAVNERDISISILKAFAIILVVTAHAGGPDWLRHAAYIACVSVFFFCTGFLFNMRGECDSIGCYIWKKMRNLYCPFWVWSVAFLILHNLFFSIGFLNEEYGNAAGGVTHLYDFHEFCQRLWSITFNMSGYDEFIGGAFWFFRTMFISSISFYLIFKLIRRFVPAFTSTGIVVSIIGGTFLLILWKLAMGLKITGVAQGGYRELLAILLIGIGFLYRSYSTFFHRRWLVATVGCIVWGVFAIYAPTSMSHTATINQFLTFLLSAFVAFVSLHGISVLLARKENFITRGLIYLGNHTLYVFAFHLLAFKLVSIIKVLVNGMPYAYVGGHPVVHVGAFTDGFYLLYILVGICVPLLVLEGWKKLDNLYNLTCINCLKYTFIGLLTVSMYIYKLLKRITISVYKSVKGFIQDMKVLLKGSSAKEDE